MISLIILGGLVMTAISLIIPPLLHYSCYKKTLSWFSIFMHFFVGIFSIVFMGISTFYSVKALIEQRNIARANKNWAEADRIRDLLNAQGIKINDKKIG